jgi:CAAX prenyl protease-like protein
MDFRKIKTDRTLAHVVPLGAFMVVLMLLQGVTGAFEETFRDHSSLPWWRSKPEHWLYPVQILVVAPLLIYWRKCYCFRWEGWGKILLGVLAGVVGIGFWILPTQLYEWMELEGETTGILHLLGVRERAEGFNPSLVFAEGSAAWWTTTGCRFLRAVVIVALVEEVFWRGFLMRFLLDRDGDYWKQPFGKPALISFVVVTLAFMIAHAPVDYAGALVYGSLTYGLAVWTKSLLSCVVMHGTANLIMGWYALQFGKYGLW